MDSLGIPQQIRKQRLGHSSNGVIEGYMHTPKMSVQRLKNLVSFLALAGRKGRWESRFLSQIFPKNKTSLLNRISKPLRMNKIWLRGVDLNHRFLGYELTSTSMFNNLQDAGGPRKAL
jgi:hypothetical protein